MDRSKIKAQAREMMKDNLWTLIKPLLVTGLIAFITAELGIAIFGENSPLSSIISLATLPISFGSASYYLKFSRKQEVDINELFAYYNKFIPIILLSMLMSIIVGLWTILFIVPGIIAAISYSQATYLFLDGEEDASDCLKKSKQMMYGYKSDYLTFQLSFIPWLLFVVVTLGFGALYVGPYMTLAECIYYDELKKLTNN